MSKIELGSVGAVVNPTEDSAYLDQAVGLEQAGFSTIWITGGPLDNLGQLAAAVATTKRARVASGILPVFKFPADEVIAFHQELEASHPGRFVLGLGGAHSADPFATLNEYLDRLDAAGIPASARLMAGLGPRMIDLARERASGVFPVLVTPEYVRQVRARLGDDKTLAVEQIVAVETDPERARALARQPLGFLGRAPFYQASFHRQGFNDDEIASLDDRLVDSLVAWGDADAVAARITEQLEAGADHVAISLVTDLPDDEALAQWQQLADRLIG
jgi:probable F420-dependent oxidoreductase